MKVTYELKQGNIEFELSDRQVCEYIAYMLCDTAKLWKEMPQHEAVARMTEALLKNADTFTLEQAFWLNDYANEVADYFAKELLYKEEYRDWCAECNYDCDDRGD